MATKIFRIGSFLQYGESILIPIENAKIAISANNLELKDIGAGITYKVIPYTDVEKSTGGNVIDRADFLIYWALEFPLGGGASGSDATAANQVLNIAAIEGLNEGQDTSLLNQYTSENVLDNMNDNLKEIKKILYKILN